MPTPGALSGLLVVSLEQAVAAPLCTQRLADAGARVIKVERAAGETARHYDKAVAGTSAYFAWLNRGKESIALDIKSAADLALLNRMIERADIFVQNFAPGAMQRLGLGARDLVARHPRLIAVEIVGYGQDTEYRDMRAYDLLVQAESGVCAVTGSPEAPAKAGVSMADYAAGMNAHAAVLEALIARGRSGQGQALEIALFDGMAEWMAVPLLHLEHQDKDTKRFGLSHAIISPYGPVECRDGVIIIAVQNPAEWERFARGVLQRPDLIEDQRFLDNPTRVRHRAALEEEMAGVFGALTCAEAIARLTAEQIAWGRLSGVADVLRHPALRRVEAVLPGGETFEVPMPANRASAPRGSVPAIGEDGERIRAEFS